MRTRKNSDRKDNIAMELGWKESNVFFLVNFNLL